MLGVCDRVVHCAISERRLLSQRFASVVTAHQHHSHVTPLMAQFWLGVGGRLQREPGTGSVKLGSEVNCQYFGLLLHV